MKVNTNEFWTDSNPQINVFTSLTKGKIKPTVKNRERAKSLNEYSIPLEIDSY